MEKLTFLGTGCGLPMSDRHHTSLLLEAAGKKILLDAGEPCSHVLKKREVAFSSIDAVIISHGHSDHIAGLAMFLQGCWLSQRHAALPIHLPRELIKPVRNWLEAVYLPDSLLGFPIEWIPWEENPEIEIGGVKIRCFPSSHLDSLRRIINPRAKKRFLAYCFRIVTGKKTMVWSADIGSPSDLAPALEPPIDLLVCELSHFSQESLFDFLEGKPIRRLYLNHLSPNLSNKSDLVLRAAKAALPQIGEIVIPRDSDEFRI